MIRLLLTPLYPLLVHLAVLGNSAWIAGLALFLLAALTLYPALHAARRAAWMGLIGIGAVLVALAQIGTTTWLLYVPPIAFPLVVLGAFASSLLPGRTALVSSIAASVHGPLPESLARYTRAVTWLWVIVIGGMLAANLVLSFGESRHRWSLFTNGGDYLLLTSVFLLEYAWRRFRFRHLREPSFADYLRLVLRHRPGIA
jgi:uncharacterized membrane protein